MFQILETKAHLIEEPVMPDCLVRLATSVIIFNEGTKLPGGATPDHIGSLPEAQFPWDFVTYIIETTERLNQNLSRLYASSRMTPSGERRQEIGRHNAEGAARTPPP
jgi:hypothetical protein